MNGRYTVIISPRAARDLEKAPAHVEKRAQAIIDKLAENPRPLGALKLKGAEQTWRVRVGDWRVVYEIRDDKLIVLILRVPPRGGAYK